MVVPEIFHLLSPPYPVSKILWQGSLVSHNTRPCLDILPMVNFHRTSLCPWGQSALRDSSPLHWRKLQTSLHMSRVLQQFLLVRLSQCSFCVRDLPSGRWPYDSCSSPASPSLQSCSRSSPAGKSIITNELHKRQAGEFCDILTTCLIARDRKLDEWEAAGHTAWISGLSLTAQKKKSEKTSYLGESRDTENQWLASSVEFSQELNRNCKYYL